LAQGFALRAFIFYVMQHLFYLLALVSAINLRGDPDVEAVRDQLKQLNKQLNGAITLEDKAKSDLANATARVATSVPELDALKAKEANLTQQLEQRKKAAGLDEMKAKIASDKQLETKLEGDNSKITAQIASSKAEEATLTTEHDVLAKEDAGSTEKLHLLVAKLGMALETAKEGANAVTSLAQMPTDPVMDKTGAAPEQGFEGHAVEHANGETATADWTNEYVVTTPKPNSAALCAVGLIALLY